MMNNMISMKFHYNSETLSSVTDPDLYASYQMDLDDLINIQKDALIQKYMDTDNYIIDRICEQQDFHEMIPLCPEETIILNAVYAAFCDVKLSDIIADRDRDSYEKVLKKLLKDPVIEPSRRLKRDICLIWGRLMIEEDFDFIEDSARLLNDWLLITKYFYHYCVIKH